MRHHDEMAHYHIRSWPKFDKALHSCDDGRTSIVVKASALPAFQRTSSCMAAHK